MERLTEKVNELRKKKGWAQKDLGREIGVGMRESLGSWSNAALLSKMYCFIMVRNHLEEVVE